MQKDMQFCKSASPAALCGAAMAACFVTMHSAAKHTQFTGRPSQKSPRDCAPLCCAECYSPH